MRRWLWLFPTVVAICAWGLWLVFVVAALPEGVAEPAEAVRFRTGAFLAAIAATGATGALRRGLRR